MDAYEQVQDSDSSASVEPEDHPLLRWKPSTLLHTKNLKSARPSSLFPNLNEALDAADRRGKNNVVLVTRMQVGRGWAFFEYIGSSGCKIAFSELHIGYLPLGGNPFIPQTYLIDGKGQFTHIMHEELSYRLAKTDRPVTEPTVSSSWVNAIVPVEEVNDGKNLTWNPQITLLPTLEELPTTLAWVNERMSHETKVKAGGALHAWSKIATTNNVFIAPGRMKMTRTIDKEPNIYHDNLGERRRDLVRAGSGTNIREMNRFLWEHGKSFPALGGFDGQTMGGVFNTGTHGSVFTRGPLLDMVVSIDLVLADGRSIRIEPSDGITSPAALATKRPDLQLIQKDDYFHAALINMGTMGVVHSLMLEVTDAFHLNEIRTKIDINILRDTLRGEKMSTLCGVQGRPADLENAPPRISNGNDGGFKGHPFPAYHLETLISPYSDKVIITSRHPISVTADDDASFGFSPPGRDLLWTIERGAKFSRPAFPTWIEERFRPLLVWGYDTLIKLFPRVTPGLIDRAMDSLIDEAYIDRSFNVFNTGDGVNRIPALAGSIYVPLESDIYVEAIEVVQNVAKQFAASGRYATGPVSMRFVKSTRALLGCRKDYCSFEFIFTSSTTWALEMVEAYDLALRKRFGNEVRGHWGQLLRDPTPEELRAMYPHYDHWRAIRDEFDPHYRFLNEWQTKVLR